MLIDGTHGNRRRLAAMTRRRRPSDPALPVVAIAHDYLTQRGGAERVVLALHEAFPEATIYTTLYEPDDTYPQFADADIVTSPLNRIGMLRRHYRFALPLLAFVSSATRVDADVTIASSSGWAHGFRCSGRKLVYCHSPARWLYLTEEYVGSSTLKRVVANVLRRPLTRWDQRASRTADRYLANSHMVRDRIDRVYGRDADVLAPASTLRADGPLRPVDGMAEWAADGYHLVVSRLLPYKNVAPVVEAFRDLPDRRLLIIGEGPLGGALAESAPPNVRLVGCVDDAQMRWAYANCTALVAASHEDFGLTPLEAGAWGHPSVALHSGGFLDTVVDGVNGVFFEEPTSQCIRDAVIAASEVDWDAEGIRQHVEQFGVERFVKAMIEQVEDLAESTSPASTFGDEADREPRVSRRARWSSAPRSAGRPGR